MICNSTMIFSCYSTKFYDWTGKLDFKEFWNTSLIVSVSFLKRHIGAPYTTAFKDQAFRREYVFIYAEYIYWKTCQICLHLQCIIRNVISLRTTWTFFLHRPRHKGTNTSCYVLIEEGKSISLYGYINPLMINKILLIKFQWSKMFPRFWLKFYRVLFDLELNLFETFHVDTRSLVNVWCTIFKFHCCLEVDLLW